VKGAPLALILNELLINALRHAFPDGPGGGHIGLALRRRDDQQRFEVQVEDDGVGLSPCRRRAASGRPWSARWPAAPRRRGLGAARARGRDARAPHPPLNGADPS
jgi:anti-sigma regulatory factor (Ser/Thr protein kinase)